MTPPPQAPIFVIGTHRSGTTILGRALGRHPEVAYWEEPREVWSHGNSFRSDDHLDVEQLTPAIERHIKRRFARFLARSGRTRLAEKTPSNCLRLEFIRRIFPDALFVNIVRDGRAVIHSTNVMTREARVPVARLGARRLLGMPPWEWPALAPRVWRTLGRRSLGLKMDFWGPQPPGWRDWVRDDPHLLVLAKQWVHTVEPTVEFGGRIAREQWLRVRYEELVREPLEHGRRIQRFARLERDQGFEQQLADECTTDRIDAWRQHLDEEELRLLQPVVEPALRSLGYAW